MPNFKILIGITITIITLVIVAIVYLDINQLSSYGSIIAAGGSLLAVLWFTASLMYQSKQLDDQKNQFKIQFKYLKEANHRDLLQTAKNILESAEERAIKANGNVSSITELVTQYQIFSELKPILESENPEEVMLAHQSWMKKEGPAMIFLKGIKSAAEIYLKSSNVQDIDYSKPAEEFVFIYGCHFWNQPFFEVYEGSATLLCEFMIRLQPGRKAAFIAFFAASAKTMGENIIKMDVVYKDIEEHKAEGYPLPKIAMNI
ncbi:MAG: hypothetical protein OIF55_00020 [Amphritea sp.]|nr:hypothetical protein [Amphritea sp.]